MQLPRSKYSRTKTPHFGRHDINAPIRVAAAEGRAAEAGARGARQQAEFGQKLYQGQQRVIEAEHRGASRLQRYEYTMDEADRRHRDNTINNVLGLARAGSQLYTHMQQVQKTAATAESSEIVARYKFAAADAANLVSQDRYSVDDAGVIRDNSNSLIDNWSNSTDSLHKIHLEGIEDPLVRARRIHRLRASPIVGLGLFS